MTSKTIMVEGFQVCCALAPAEEITKVEGLGLGP